MSSLSSGPRRERQTRGPTIQSPLTRNPHHQLRPRDEPTSPTSAAGSSQHRHRTDAAAQRRKRGHALELRVGEAASRFTPDFDASRSKNVTLDDYLDDLAQRLAAGWAGFTGTVEEIDAPQPEGVPDEYVMRPFDIRLAYKGRHWLTVRFELGHDEIGSSDSPEFRVAHDIVDMFETLELQTPTP